MTKKYENEEVAKMNAINNRSKVNTYKKEKPTINLKSGIINGIAKKNTKKGET
jgi:hypothetical protein